MEPIEPRWQAIKQWIPDDEPDPDWFNRPRSPSNPDPDGIDQRPTTPFSPPSGLRQGFYRQAGLAQRLFQEPPAKSKFLAVQTDDNEK